MKKNIGIVKAYISNKLKENYLQSNSLNESKELTKDFFSIIKESEILGSLLSTFKNIENKHIINDVVATRYIDESISIFNKYTKDEILNECAKLDKFNINGFDCENANLYESINTLILHSSKSDDMPDVDIVHEAFVTVLDYIKTDKNKDLTESKVIDFNYEYFTPETVIGVALNKFNEKFNSLDEREKKILQVLTFGDKQDKVTIFETLRKENLAKLQEMKGDDIQDKITETISKIEKMGSEDNVIAENTINLFELKKNLA